MNDAYSIAQERLARGEIDADEYKKIIATIQETMPTQDVTGPAKPKSKRRKVFIALGSGLLLAAIIGVFLATLAVQRLQQDLKGIEALGGIAESLNGLGEETE